MRSTDVACAADMPNAKVLITRHGKAETVQYRSLRIYANEHEKKE